MINTVINKLICSNIPTDVELTESFEEIFSGLSTPASISSYVTLLKEKEDIFSSKSLPLTLAIKASREAVKKNNFLLNTENAIETIFLNKNGNFFDLNFALDIMLASNDVPLVKYAFDTPFEEEQSFKTLKAFGVQPELFFRDLSENFEKTNFLYILLSKQEAYFKYTDAIKRQLPFKSIFNVTDKFLSPYGAKNQYIGVNSKEEVEKFANVCLNIGNFNTMVVSGLNGLPYASIEGETYVAEAWKNKIFTYALTPDLLGLKTASIEELKTESVEHNKEEILNIFNNKLQDAFYNEVILNSALALYIIKKATSVMDGILLAKKTISNGLALQKLQQIQNIYS